MLLYVMGRCLCRTQVCLFEPKGQGGGSSLTNPTSEWGGGCGVWGDEGWGSGGMGVGCRCHAQGWDRRDVE